MYRIFLSTTAGLLAVAFAAVGVEPPLPYTYDRASKNQSGLKASDICLSCRMVHEDHPAQDAVEAWRPNRLEWSYITDPDFIAFVRDHGAVFVGTLNTIGDEGDEYDAERFDGARMVAPWMMSFHSHGGPGWNSVNKPAVFAAQVAVLKKFIDCDVTTFQHDDWFFNLASYSWGGGDFSAESRTKFATYLAGHATDADKAAAGVASWDGFDYKAYLARTFRTDDVERLKASRRNDPLDRHWRRFHLLCTRDYFERLLAEGGKMAGRPIQLTVNATLLDPCDNFLLDKVDYLVGETPVGEDFNPDEMVSMLRLADALHLPQVVSPYPKGGIQVGNVRLAAALTYALGHRFLVPWDVWAGPGQPRWFGSREDYSDLFDFVRDNAVLLDGYRAYTEVAVVLPLAGDAQLYRTGLKLAQGVSRQLGLDGVPCRYAACGEVAGLIRVPLDRGDFEGLAATAVCGDVSRWTADDTAAFGEATQTQAVCREPELEAMLTQIREHVPTPVYTLNEPRILVVPRVNSDDPAAPVVVHLVNLDVPRENVDLFLAERLFKTVPQSATLLQPGAEKETLTITPAEKGIRVMVPKLDLWGIVTLR